MKYSDIQGIAKTVANQVYSERIKAQEAMLDRVQALLLCVVDGQHKRDVISINNIGGYVKFGCPFCCHKYTKVYELCSPDEKKIIKEQVGVTVE